MKIKLFIACQIQYLEFGIFSFNSYVYNLTRGFIASARVFNLPTRAFNHPTRAFNFATCAFSLLTRGFELITRSSCFTFAQKYSFDKLPPDDYHYSLRFEKSDDVHSMLTLEGDKGAKEEKGFKI